MKRLRKITIWVLALCLLASILPTKSLAADLGSGKCGENLSWTLDKSGTLTISGAGAMYDWDFQTSPWHKDRDYIQSVVINDGVTTIGDWAFHDCASLTEASIPESIISIGDSAFYCCFSLGCVGRLSDLASCAG